MPATSTGRPPAPRSWPAGWPAGAWRGLAFGLLALAVAWFHGQGLDALGGWLHGPDDPAPPARRGAPVRPMQLVAPRPPAGGLPQRDLALPVAEPANRGGAARARAPRPAADRTTAPSSPPRPAQERDKARPLRGDATNPPPAAPAPQGVVAPVSPALAAVGEGGGGIVGLAEPTRLVPSATLGFRVQRGEAIGHGVWQWQQDGRTFSSRLQAELAGKPLLSLLSRGRFDGAGLAPERMVEFKGERPVRAVNFQRDKGLISFSGSTREWPLAPGTQDRASWLPQLLAQVNALPAAQRGSQTLRLSVAGPRGDLDLWWFRPVAVDDPSAGLAWLREPLRPYDARIEVWLSPAPPHWPLRLSWQVLPGGAETQWTFDPPTPVPDAAAP